MTLTVTEGHSYLEVTKGHGDLEGHIDLVWPKVTPSMIVTKGQTTIIVTEGHSAWFRSNSIVAIDLDYDPGSQIPCVTEGHSDL